MLPTSIIVFVLCCNQSYSRRLFLQPNCGEANFINFNKDVPCWECDSWCKWSCLNFCHEFKKARPRQSNGSSATGSLPRKPDWFESTTELGQVILHHTFRLLLVDETTPKHFLKWKIMLVIISRTRHVLFEIYHLCVIITVVMEIWSTIS